MKTLNLLLAGLILTVVSGCGKGSTTTPLTYTQANPCAQPVNYSNNNYYYGSSYNPCSSVGGVNRVQLPIYATNSVTVSGSQVTATLSVAYGAGVTAGDQIVLSNLNSVWLNQYCSGNFWNTGSYSFPLLSPAISVGGQIVGTGYNGVITATTSGALALVATANTSSCSGTPQWSLGSYSGANSAIGYVNRCTNAQGAVVRCP